MTTSVFTMLASARVASCVSVEGLWLSHCFHSAAALCAMAPHLTPAELDKIQQWSNLTDSEVLARIAKSRQRGGVEPPGLKAVQRARAGRTFRRGRIASALHVPFSLVLY